MAGGDTDAALRAFVDAIIGPGAYQLMPASTREMLTDNLPELRREAAAPAGDPPFSCEDAARVAAPVLLVTGGSSPAFFKAIDQRLAECLPSVEAVTVPGAVARRARPADRAIQRAGASGSSQRHRSRYVSDAGEPTAAAPRNMRVKARKPERRVTRCRNAAGQCGATKQVSA